MNLFMNSFAKITQRKNIIFIVEDNETYAKSLHAFLQNRFPYIKEIKIFPVGELCLMELYRNPSIVIMDYFLNSNFEGAVNGIDILKRIKAQNPKTDIIVLSSQENFNVTIEVIKRYDCNYVRKGQDAFNKVEQYIKEILNRKRIAFWLRK